MNGRWIWMDGRLRMDERWMEEMDGWKMNEWKMDKDGW